MAISPVGISLEALKLGLSVAGMGINIKRSLEAEAANVTEIRKRIDQEKRALALRGEERSADVAQSVGAVQAAAAAAGITGPTVQTGVATEIASGQRAQFIDGLNTRGTIQNLEFQEDEVRRAGKAERLGQILSLGGQAIGSTSKFIERT